MLSNNTKKPEISILMSIFDEPANAIKVAIDSLLTQTFSNFELILVNDNPKSVETQKILNSVLKRDKRIKLITNDRNRGLGYALNIATLSSKADIIGRMDTGDTSLPERLAKQISFMKKNTKVDLLFTQWIDVDETGKKITRQPDKEDFKNLHKAFFVKSLMMHPTLIARKKVLLDNPYLEMGRPEDTVLWLKLIRKGYIFDIIEEPLYLYKIDRINIRKRSKKTKMGSKNLIPHLLLESKYYWTNIYFWLFFVRNIFEYLVSRNTLIFNFTHSRAVKIWKLFFKNK